MCAKLSPSRRVNWFAWNFGGVQFDPGYCLGVFSHFRSEPQNRKLAFSSWNRLYFGTNFSLESIKIHFESNGFLSDICGTYAVFLAQLISESNPINSKWVLIDSQEKLVQHYKWFRGKKANFRFWGSDRKWKSSPCNSLRLSNRLRPITFMQIGSPA